MEFKRIIFVGDRRDSLGLKLAGIESSIDLSGKEALTEVIKLIKSKEYNLIIAEEDIRLCRPEWTQFIGLKRWPTGAIYTFTGNTGK